MADTDATIPAGDFSTWLAGLEAAIRGDGDSDVPCGTCTACCTSSQFIHVGPDETDALARIPAALLFPAPRMPEGHVLMGYDQHGHCPMLVDGACSIYEHRPRTCRVYDCRVFPAAGVELDDDTKSEISRRAQQWRFSYPSDLDRSQHDAVLAAARRLERHVDESDDGLGDTAPVTVTQLAVTAVTIHREFLSVPEASELLADAGLADGTLGPEGLGEQRDA